MHTDVPADVVVELHEEQELSVQVAYTTCPLEHVYCRVSGAKGKNPPVKHCDEAEDK